MAFMKLNTAMPKHPRPVFIIGAGGIVTDAHLPAYRIAGFKVAGIYDIDHAKSAEVAARFAIPTIFDSLDAMLKAATEDVVFDLAVPGSAIANILRRLPEKAGILMQKPMGNDLEDAKEILEITRNRKQTAGVNFQLRYAPFINAARSIIQQGKIGDLCDIEVNVDVYTPWHLWKFVDHLSRVEILYHSIHYIDLVRTFLGNPIGIYAKSTRHPAMKNLSSVRSDIILNYGEWMGVNIHTRHCNIFGSQHQEAFIKFEGTKGAIKMRMGVLMDYPKGTTDLFEYISIDENTEANWETLEIEGSWFPHAFIGSMAQIMLAMEGAIARPDNSVEDCIETMACVESAYQSDSEGGVKLMPWK
jgi:predicted dehydrogenase